MMSATLESVIKLMNILGSDDFGDEINEYNIERVIEEWNYEAKLRLAECRNITADREEWRKTCYILMEKIPRGT